MSKFKSAASLLLALFILCLNDTVAQAASTSITPPSEASEKPQCYLGWDLYINAMDRLNPDRKSEDFSRLLQSGMDVFTYPSTNAIKKFIPLRALKKPNLQYWIDLVYVDGTHGSIFVDPRLWKYCETSTGSSYISLLQYPLLGGSPQIDSSTHQWTVINQSLLPSNPEQPGDIHINYKPRD